MNAWDDLPNAQLIDQVIASLKSHPDQWATAWGAAWDAAHSAAYSSTRDAGRVALWSAAYDAAWDASNGVAYTEAYNAILSLVAYDDSAKFLDMSSSELEVWAKLSLNPAAVLLLPAVQAFESIKELEHECVG